MLYHANIIFMTNIPNLKIDENIIACGKLNS